MAAELDDALLWILGQHHQLSDQLDDRSSCPRTTPAQLEPPATCAILSTAGAGVDFSRNPATVVADSGVENVNGDVDVLLGLGRLRRVLALVEVTFSNSMIEAWWRSFKHNWLFLNRLDTLAAVERLVSFYVRQHNAVTPHSALSRLELEAKCTSARAPQSRST